jgi:cell filamentation protein
LFPVSEKFDFTLLCNIHKNIFEDIYSWAGQIRKGDFFSKGSSIFCRGSLIQQNADAIFGGFVNENYLCDLEKQAFIYRLALLYGGS